MAATAADRMVECLLEWGVDTVFGLPGDGINGIMESLRQCQDRIRFVQVRHEETAALMACGYAKLTGRLGVCLATSGPGGIHLLNGLYDAKLDGAAVLAITGLAISRPRAHPHPAGRRARQVVHGCLCLQRPRHGAGACRKRHATRLPNRCEPAWCGACDHARRYAVPAAQVRRPFRPQCARPRFHGGRARHRHPVRRAAPAGGRDPGGRPEDLHSRRSGCVTRQRRTGEDRGAARGTCCQGAARESGACGPAPPLHGRGRPARDGPLRGSAAVLRYVAYRRQQLSVYRTLSQARRRPRRADRPGQRADRASLSRRMRLGGRCRAHATRIARAAPAE